MAVGQCDFPTMHPVKGIKLGTCNAGIKQTVRDDILVIEMAEGGSCAAVFTQNAFCAAPVPAPLFLAIPVLFFLT